MSYFVPQNSHSFTIREKSIIDDEIDESEADNGDVEKIHFFVFGLVVTAEYQKCKYIVESLYRYYPEKYAEPTLRPMLNVAWNDFLVKERRLRGGGLWTLNSGVAIFLNGEFMGDETVLTKYVSSKYILPMKNFFKMGREALKTYLMGLMEQGKRCVYLMISIDEAIVGTLIFMLFEEKVPKTCRLFLKRCKQLKGGYTNTPIHRIVESNWIQCGGHKLKEVDLPCENYVISHRKRGILSMCNSGKHRNNSTQFLITLQKSPWMDGHYVAFGELLHGDWVLSQIEAVPTIYQKPQKEVMIVRAGEVNLSYQKLVDGKTEKELNAFLESRMTKTLFKNYSDKKDLNVDEGQRRRMDEEMRKEFLDSDLKSYFPMKMLPRHIEDAFNYIPGKKSSCVLDTEDCFKCGCSHDVAECRRRPSEESDED